MKDGIHLEIATVGGSVYDDMSAMWSCRFPAAV